ncbi:MAG: DUF4190 domain-containing protein [Egibacteraceae bacterium]
MTEERPAAPPPGEPAYAPAPTRSNGAAITALVCGIIALLLSWIPAINLLAILLGIVALIAAFIGFGKAKEPGVGGRGMAIVGLILGLVSVIVAILVYVGLAAIFRDPDVQRGIEDIQGEIEEQLTELATEG